MEDSPKCSKCGNQMVVKKSVGILTDYKSGGSYQVGKALGIVSTDVLDPAGGVYKSGPRKGTPRMLKEYKADPAKADLEDWMYQLNQYRLFFQSAGFKVDRLQVQAIVRDGGTIIAKNRGITKNVYLIPIPIMPDVETQAFFADVGLPQGSVHEHEIPEPQPP